MQVAILPDYIYGNHIILQNPSLFGIDLIGELNGRIARNPHPLSVKFDSSTNHSNIIGDFLLLKGGAILANFV